MAALRMALDHDMTIYNAIELRQKLLDGLLQADVLEIDLSRVREIDTAGIQLLMMIKRASQSRDKTLTIVAHSPAVREAVDFYNLAAFFGDPLLIPAREGD